MGRRKKDALSARSREFKIRLTEAEYFWLKIMAEREKTTVAELLRNLFKDHIRTTLTNDEIGEYAARVVQEIKSQ